MALFEKKNWLLAYITKSVNSGRINLKFFLKWPKSQSKIIDEEHAAYNARGKGCRGKENQDQEEAKQAKFLNPSFLVGLISNFF